MATGDITSCTVRSDGWSVDLVIAGFTTGATYDFDLDTNNVPTATTPFLTVVSEGYDDTGTLGTITRTVHLTKVVRKAYPNEASLDETGGGNLTVRIALSDYVYVDDNTGAGKSGTAPTLTLKAGFVVNTGGASQSSAEVTASAVTNSSTAVYQKPIGNWSWPGYQRMTSASKLRCVAFHGSGQQARPVRAVKFSVTDGTTTNTETVTAPVYDSSMGDAVPVVEYVSTADLTAGLTQGAELTCNFIAYPWLGDASAILDTSTGAAAPSPLVGPIKAVCDRTGAYGVTVVLVDPSGNDTTGAAYDSATFDESTAAKCLTINGAMVKAAAYNNTNRSRNTLGAVEIRLNDGTYAWTGGSGSIGTTPNTWCKITRSNGSTSRSAVILATASGDTDATDRVQISGVKITGTTNLFFSSCECLWLDNCEIDQTGVSTGFALIYGVSNVWMTSNTVTVMQQGIRQSSTQNTRFCLVRGNTIDQSTAGTKTIFCYTCIGNLRTSSAVWTGSLIDDLATIPAADNNIIAYNKLLKCANVVYNNTNSLGKTGMAIVQNLFENVDNSSGSGHQIYIGADTSTGAVAVNNVILWNNTIVGMRWNIAYNDSGSDAPERRYWSVKNNITDDHNTKHDLFGTPNAARVNAWSQLHGVNWSGNILSDNTAGAIGASGLTNDFAGLSTIAPSAPAVTYMAYTDRKAWAGSADTTGGGDYTLTASSPAIAMQRDWLLPFDLAGTSRSSTSAAGAYHYGTTTSNFLFFF